ncbi:MAG TPA: SIMPL domain-containing protein [Anaeromyxobacter sp.]|nr:SIMPL domain-containing protein [Anaeromyxobacter sp.]
MRRTMGRVFLALGVLAAAGPVLAVDLPLSPGSASPRTLRVSAEGRAAARPDLGVVQAGVQVTARDPQKASAEVAARISALLAELGRLGIAERDVRTSEVSLRPERPFESGRQLPVQGYTATSGVRILVRRLSELPVLLGRLTAVGVNDIDSVELSKEDLGPVRDQALSLAVSAARARAKAVASAAGVTLGEVISIEVDPGASPGPRVAGMVMSAAPAAGSEMPVAEGELEVTARVEMVFVIR